MSAEFVFLIKAAERPVSLAELLSYLDGEDRVAGRQQNRKLTMGCTILARPRRLMTRSMPVIFKCATITVSQRGVHRYLGPVVAVKDVVRRLLRRLEYQPPRCLGHVRLPVAIVGQSMLGPPGQRAGK